MWLRVATSNKDSSVILLYYLMAVLLNKGMHIGCIFAYDNYYDVFVCII